MNPQFVIAKQEHIGNHPRLGENQTIAVNMLLRWGYCKFDDGDELVISTRDSKARFLLVSGKPLNEPVAWYGPIVMNTQEELKIAFKEFRNGTFLK